MKTRNLGDDERYVYNGEPTLCWECNEKLLFRQYVQHDGSVIVQIFCPKYGGEPSKNHDFYRWIA